MAEPQTRPEMGLALTFIGQAILVGIVSVSGAWLMVRTEGWHWAPAICFSAASCTGGLLLSLLGEIAKKKLEA